MSKKRNTFARRFAGRMMLWMTLALLVLAYLLYRLEGNAVSEFYAEIYRNKMLITKEYTRRVLSDVYVAVTNNIYYVEHALDNPDTHKATMERIVISGTRVRSCGISFIADYYPQKGHHFCPFAWRGNTSADVTYSQDLGDADLDYLGEKWFTEIVERDSAQWSEPFYDSYEKTPLSAYMAPIHDAEGRVVAVLSADVSLDWLTGKLSEADSTINKNSMLMSRWFKMKSRTFIINHDGTFLTHSDEKNILTGNFYSQLKPCGGNSVERLVAQMKEGKDPETTSCGRYMVGGEECLLFYTPVKYTKWLFVSAVPCHAIDLMGILNTATLLVIILMAMLVLVAAAYYYMKSTAEPLRMLTHPTNDMARGRLDTPVPEVRHNDEISRLRDAIEDMRFTLSCGKNTGAQAGSTP